MQIKNKYKTLFTSLKMQNVDPSRKIRACVNLAQKSSQETENCCDALNSHPRSSISYQKFALLIQEFQSAAFWPKRRFALQPLAASIRESGTCRHSTHRDTDWEDAGDAVGDAGYAVGLPPTTPGWLERS